MRIVGLWSELVFWLAMLCLDCALFDVGKALLQSLRNEVEFAVRGLRVARHDCVEHGYHALGIRLDLKVFLSDDVANFRGTRDGHPHLHKTYDGVYRAHT